MPEPPQLTPLDVEEQRLYSEPLLDVRAPHSISKAEPSHPAKEAHFILKLAPSGVSGNCNQLNNRHRPSPAKKNLKLYCVKFRVGIVN